jgi:hypothetical protein
MRLREVASYRYQVYAVCGSPTEMDCEVEQFLLQYSQSYPKAMRNLNTILRSWTPQHGPPYEVEERAKRLRGDICEFRAEERRQKKVPRILFFEDGMRIICTNAFLKKGSTPDHEIDRAVEIRREYFRQNPLDDLTNILKGWGLP